jgi:hypothetical protein
LIVVHGIGGTSEKSKAVGSQQKRQRLCLALTFALASQQFRQLGDVRCDPSRFIAVSLFFQAL